MTLDTFWSGLGFDPDPFQRAAAEAVADGASVVVTAPTGSGKTLVAEAAVHLALEREERAFYTTPIKALSNQKYADFSAIYGSERVGLLTGDNSINGSAPLVVMTTEVLRNMIYAGSADLAGLGVAVLDEVHYLQDRVRGAVWEEIIIHAPPHVQMVGLSATVENATEFAQWVRSRRGRTELIVEERRPVPLESLYLLKDRWATPPLRLFPTFRGPTSSQPNPRISRLLSQTRRRRFGTPRRTEVIEFLAAEGMLPVIYFIFSRDGCDSAVAQVIGDGVRLAQRDEQEEIRRVAEERTNHLGRADLTALGYEAWLSRLQAGVASHHAGMVPAFKETVEILFTRGLVSVVFATETLALGINMPAKTVVLESLSKFTGESHELLQPGDYTQLTGRAGRRGIDLHGYGVVLHSPYVRFEQVAAIAATGTHPLRSSFRPTYNMAANLVANYPSEQAEALLNASFAQFQREGSALALEGRVAALQAEIETARTEAECRQGSIWEYLDLLDGRPPGSGRGGSARQFLAGLRPGDVVDLPGGRRAGRYVLLQRKPGWREHGNVLMLSTSGRLSTWRPDDVIDGTVRVGSVELPTPFRPRDRKFQQRTLRALRALRARPEEAFSASRESLAHPVATCDELPAHLRAGRRARRLERRLARANSEMALSGEALVTEFRSILELLESWKYTAGWSLTEKGERLRFIYNELDLLVAETVERGGLIGLSGAELAAVVSAFVFEPRAEEMVGDWPTAESRARWDSIVALSDELAAMERAFQLPESRAPESGFAPLVYVWARGLDLDDVLADDALPAGDFVRVCRQVLDLLRQLRDAWPDLTEQVDGTIQAIDRGVVAAGGIG